MTETYDWKKEAVPVSSDGDYDWRKEAELVSSEPVPGSKSSFTDGLKEAGQTIADYSHMAIASNPITSMIDKGIAYGGAVAQEAGDLFRSPENRRTIEERAQKTLGEIKSVDDETMNRSPIAGTIGQVQGVLGGSVVIPTPFGKTAGITGAAARTGTQAVQSGLLEGFGGEGFFDPNRAVNSGTKTGIISAGVETAIPAIKYGSKLMGALAKRIPQFFGGAAPAWINRYIDRFDEISKVASNPDEALVALKREIDGDVSKYTSRAALAKDELRQAEMNYHLAAREGKAAAREKVADAQARYNDAKQAFKEASEAQKGAQSLDMPGPDMPDTLAAKADLEAARKTSSEFNPNSLDEYGAMTKAKENYADAQSKADQFSNIGPNSTEGVLKSALRRPQDKIEAQDSLRKLGELEGKDYTTKVLDQRTAEAMSKGHAMGSAYTNLGAALGYGGKALLGGAIGSRFGDSSSVEGMVAGALAGAAGPKYMPGVTKGAIRAVMGISKYAGALSGALKRGNSALAATHFLMMQDDPEYRKLIQNNSGEDDNEQP
jgi:hypothetical protein